MPSTSVVSTTDSSSHVDVTVPLRSEFASIVRLVAASLGADAGFSVDDIDDLRLAMSEVFSSLVGATASGAGDTTRIAITFDTAGPGLAVTLSAADSLPTDSLPVLELDELATSIIGVAVDEFHVDGGTVRLVKFGADQRLDQPAS
jgi:hypothetical protein